MAYSPEHWTNFFIAGTGAAAALAGLVIVAISVNIKEILSFTSLPMSAASTVAMLIMILAACRAGLFPGWGPRPLGIELAGFALVGLSLQVLTIRDKLRQLPKRPRYEIASTTAMAIIQVALWLIGELSLIGQRRRPLLGRGRRRRCLCLFRGFKLGLAGGNPPLDPGDRDQQLAIGEMHVPLQQRWAFPPQAAASPAVQGQPTSGRSGSVQ